ncbi:MAG: hypothetical protein ACYDB1_10290 [Acidiferrobacteraceae bacterium]
MPDQYLIDAIERAFQFMGRRATIIEAIIASHRREFGEQAVEPSIDAICLGMVSLAALGKYRFGAETDKYGEQFRRLLKNYCSPSFEDRISIPEFLDNAHSGGICANAIEAVRRRYPIPIDGEEYDPHKDPIVADFTTFVNTAKIEIKPRDLARFEHSHLIYKKYRNPIVHALQIADGNEPLNLWHNRPCIFYSNQDQATKSGTLESSRKFGVTDDFVLLLLREAIKNLQAWCISKGEYIFR